MAGSDKVYIDDDNYELTVKPLSWLRRCMFDLYPYWQGAKPKFWLIVKRLGSSTNQSYGINWQMMFPNGIIAPAPYATVTVPPLKTNKQYKAKVGGQFLGPTGDVLLVILLQVPVGKDFKTLYAFHTTPQTWGFLAVIAGLLAGIFASLFQSLFQPCP